jgi:hypothetical protein
VKQSKQVTSYDSYQVDLTQRELPGDDKPKEIAVLDKGLKVETGVNESHPVLLSGPL